MSKANKKPEAVNEVVTTQESAVPVVAQDLEAWGESDISAKDIIIPKILAMQGLSDLVTEGKATMGDFVDSMDGTVLGNIDKPVNFIPFHMEKIYIISKKAQGESRFAFDRIEGVEAQNYPFTSMDGTTEIKYEYTLQFYVLRPEDTSIPYVISFKSTSLKAGKVLATQMYVRNKAAGLVPPAYTMNLAGKKEKNDQGTYVVMQTSQGEKASGEQINDCLGWLQAVKAGKTQVAPDAEQTASAQNTNF